MCERKMLLYWCCYSVVISICIGANGMQGNVTTTNKGSCSHKIAIIPLAAPSSSCGFLQLFCELHSTTSPHVQIFWHIIISTWETIKPKRIKHQRMIARLENDDGFSVFSVIFCRMTMVWNVWFYAVNTIVEKSFSRWIADKLKWKTQ